MFYNGQSQSRTSLFSSPLRDVCNLAIVASALSSYQVLFTSFPSYHAMGYKKGRKVRLVGCRRLRLRREASHRSLEAWRRAPALRCLWLQRHSGSRPCHTAGATGISRRNSGSADATPKPVLVPRVNVCSLLPRSGGGAPQRFLFRGSAV